MSEVLRFMAHATTALNVEEQMRMIGQKSKKFRNIEVLTIDVREV